MCICMSQIVRLNLDTNKKKKLWIVENHEVYQYCFRVFFFFFCMGFFLLSFFVCFNLFVCFCFCFLLFLFVLLLFFCLFVISLFSIKHGNT